MNAEEAEVPGNANR